MKTATFGLRASSLSLTNFRGARRRETIFLGPPPSPQGPFPPPVVERVVQAASSQPPPTTVHQAIDRPAPQLRLHCVEEPVARSCTVAVE